MAHSLSSKKRIRQNTKRRDINRSRKTALKTKLRRSQTALAKGNVTEAEAACHVAAQALDREASRGTIHRNAAARRKSRMARRLNLARQKSAAAGSAPSA